MQNSLQFVLKKKTSKNQRLSWEIAFSRDYSKFSRFGQNAKGQFWPIVIAELWKPRKIANTYRILVKIALSDADFIVVCVKTKTSKKPTPISWEIAIFPRLLKIEPFWPKCKGPILADFHRWNLEALKIGNIYRISVKIALINPELIVVCVKTKTSKKPTPISWEIAFFPAPTQNWAILAKMQRANFGRFS